MHKNRLQEHVQKSGLPLPVYRIDNEGFAHAPNFRSTVVVNGKEYRSRKTYSHRKEAEQDAAEFALKSILDDINNEECTIVPDLMYSKSILNEYAVKKNLESPQYVTTQAGRLHIVFVSTLVFNGRSYTGQLGKTRKEAEQLAAFATVQSLLESNSCGYLHQIIKSKLKMPRNLHQANPSARTTNLCAASSSKHVTDTAAGTTKSIYGLDSGVIPGDKNKRKPENDNLGTKKLPREYGFQFVSAPLDKTKGKANYAVYKKKGK